MKKIIVWSEVAGYMWAYMENGIIYDDLGERPDLENEQNDKLIDLQLRGE